MENIHIRNKDDLEKKINFMKKRCLDHLYILSDFDGTVTKAFYNGKQRPSLISILYTEGYLSDGYQKTAQGFFDYYHPIEIDESIALSERKKAMEEWRVKHKSLLVGEGLSKQNIYDAMKSQNVVLRDGVNIFFEFLKENSVPLVILSAGGLGTLSIKRYLEMNNSWYDNIYLIGNEFIWDENGVAIDFQRPVIHSLNKDETVVCNFYVYEKVKDRKNVILLGDGIGDIKMIDGFNYENLIKIGFLNKDVDQKLDLYMDNYDVVITNDGSMDYVNEFIVKLS